MANSLIRQLTNRYFWVTNTLTTATLRSGGDLIEQTIEIRQLAGKKEDKNYDWHRAGRMFAVGLIQGPIFHGFYSYLDKIFKGQTLKTVTIKILCDQFIGAPIFISTYLYGLGILERASLTDINREVVQKFPVIYMADWFVWPPAQFINFYFVPSHYRVAYVGCLAVVWNVFLSHMKHNDVDLKGIIITKFKRLQRVGE